jgi:hypothetical protein
MMCIATKVSFAPIVTGGVGAFSGRAREIRSTIVETIKKVRIGRWLNFEIIKNTIPAPREKITLKRITSVTGIGEVSGGGNCSGNKSGSLRKRVTKK